MRPLQVLAAGSLRHVWPAIEAACRSVCPQGIVTQFGPAGLLRERIEQGEACDLFASASLRHAQALLDAGLAQTAAPFCRNRLCLSVRRELLKPTDRWQDVLSNPAVRIGTSTPGCDPCGDYAWQLLDRLAHREPAIRQRAFPLVGGRDSPPVPPGVPAARWAIASGQADCFIGYQSYASLTGAVEDIAILPIDDAWQPRAEYGIAVCTEEGTQMAALLLSPAGQQILQRAGFLPLQA